MGDRPVALRPLLLACADGRGLHRWDDFIEGSEAFSERSTAKPPKYTSRALHR